ncbi:peptide chain release factor N(5)-glutamine methyltransferase [Anaerosporobacter faecicola]|uniref:peptide chain release factor N(5)-glutamine methyltransferase n=1 Tax=Anaerosporobacter faecicola TaxID=2718714 RepID=UPI00143C4302|nr:peptide chain release factor N(5)-glutamine methyltransferase [Anaerosporobacter faecicola]
MSSLATILKQAEKKLQSAGIEEAKIDAWYLAMECFSITKTDYYMNPNMEIPSEQYQTYQAMIQARAEHIPYQYLTHQQEFMGISFYVDENVLIPRQDTEVLVERAMKYANNADILDMCTGSGCIIVSLGKLCETKSLTAVDISKKALEVAKKNASTVEVPVTFIESDLFAKVTGTYDMIVSNPPYIPTKVIEGLMPEVKEHEPMLALDGTEDGLHFYRILAKEAGNYLNKDGHILLEIGHDQGQEVKALLEDAGFSEVQIIKDLPGLDRVVIGKKNCI